MSVRCVPVLLALALALAFAAGCGGSNERASDPVERVPDSGGVRQAVREARSPQAADFPSAEGKTLQQVADLVAAGPQAALAGSVYTAGENRFAFGVIDKDGAAVYGPSAVYIAPDPAQPAQGPFVAPADVLLTEGRYRSRQAATESDPFAAIYAAQVKFPKPGRYAVLVMTRRGGQLVGAPTEIEVVSKAGDAIPDVGERAPAVHTDTVESAKGDIKAIDTRVPSDDMHDVDFASVVGKKPVALLFATPQLCASRVCGPVTDIALQVKASYGDRMTFIHEEVYQDNDASKPLRDPLRAFKLETEPWLFVVDKTGRVTARLEGSFGVDAFEAAVKTGL
jgi:hypothetical protein